MSITRYKHVLLQIVLIHYKATECNTILVLQKFVLLLQFYPLTKVVRKKGLYSTSYQTFKIISRDCT